MHFISCAVHINVLILQCIRALAAFKCIVVPWRSSMLNLCVVVLEFHTSELVSQKCILLYQRCNTGTRRWYCISALSCLKVLSVNAIRCLVIECKICVL